MNVEKLFEIYYGLKTQTGSYSELVDGLRDLILEVLNAPKDVWDGGLADLDTFEQLIDLIKTN